MRLILQLSILSFGLFSFGQNLPRNPKPGMCYEKCFDYEAQIKWVEISCDSIKKSRPDGFFKIKGEEATNITKSRIKFKKYQEKLIKLGYDLEVTGRMDENTIEAHHHYLKDKKKAAKKEAKRLKKAKRDASKKH